MILRLLVGVLVLVAASPRGWAAVPDVDGDTVSDADEGAPLVDTDGDLTPDYLDKDSDGDGVLDALEAGDASPATPPVDTDGDQVPDLRDVDSDNDTLPDAVEDADGDGKVSAGETDAKTADSDADGIPDGLEDKNLDGAVDPGECHPLRPDTDGDMIVDSKDACCAAAEDVDGLKDTDGCPETDADDDGIPDTVEQGHACLDPLDADSDDDGLSDGAEDANANGVHDSGETDPCDLDTDQDRVPDGLDRCPLVAEDADAVQDGDGCPESEEGGGGTPVKPGDYDGDDLPDAVERAGCTDPYNADSDGDGGEDGEEDVNLSGAVDPGETDPCHPDVDPMGGVGCALGPSGSAADPGLGALLALLWMLGLGRGSGHDREARRPHHPRRTWLGRRRPAR